MIGAVVGHTVASVRHYNGRTSENVSSGDVMSPKGPHCATEYLHHYYVTRKREICPHSIRAVIKTGDHTVTFARTKERVGPGSRVIPYGIPFGGPSDPMVSATHGTAPNKSEVLGL